MIKKNLTFLGLSIFKIIFEFNLLFFSIFNKIHCIFNFQLILNL